MVMAALRATHPDQAINQVVSEYYIAQEIDTTTDGMLIAIPEKEWTLLLKSAWRNWGVSFSLLPPMLT